MSIRTTVVLEDDVIEKLKIEQRNRGVPFRSLLNDMLRLALATPSPKPVRRNFEIKPFKMGYKPGLTYDDVESVLAYAEGENHR